MREIVISGGKVRFVYDDRLHVVLGQLGRVRITRASTVEFDHARGGWMAYLTPTVPGVVLGPYGSRTHAVEAERDWIEAVLRGDDQFFVDALSQRIET